MANKKIVQIHIETNARLGNTTIEFYRQDGEDVTVREYPVNDRRGDTIDNLFDYGGGNKLVSGPTIYTHEKRMKVIYHRKG